MTTYVALLRAVNVGGNNRLSMADLRSIFARIGLEDAQTLLQTGNVVFSCSQHRGPDLERLLEAEVKALMGTSIDVVMRASDQFRKAVEGNPFPKEAREDPGRLAVMFTKQAPTPSVVEDLRASIVGPEVLQAVGDHVYIYYPDGMGQSKLTMQKIESKLGTRGTARNWNTVIKIAAAATSR